MYRKNSTRAAGLAALLSALTCTSLPAFAGDPEAPLPRFWGDFGIGGGSLDSSEAPLGDRSGAFLAELTLGGRLGDHWLLGINLGGVGSQISSNFDNSCGCGDSSAYGQQFNHILLATQYEPDRNRGWLFGAGLGKVLYHNRALQELSGDYRSGDGTGGVVRLGYDWPIAGGTHVEAQLSFEGGRVTLSAPFGGSFSYRAVGVSAHISYH